MRQPRHADARGVEPVEIGEVPFEVVQPLDREHRADRRAFAPAPAREQAVQLARRRHPGEAAVRGGHCPVQLLAVVERALEQRCPGADRLQLGDHQRGDIVAIAVVGVVVLAARRLGDAGEDLQRHVAFLHPRQILVPAPGAGEEVAIPHQGVGMQVDDGQRFVQRARFVGHGDRRLAVDPVHAAFDQRRAEREEGARGHRHDRQQAPGQPRPHAASLTRVTKSNAGNSPAAGCSSRRFSAHSGPSRGISTSPS